MRTGIARSLLDALLRNGVVGAILVMVVLHSGALHETTILGDLGAIPNEPPSNAPISNNSVSMKQQETSSTSSSWPGQPTRVLGPSKEDNKLVRIGQGMDDPRQFLLDHLEEFIKIYKNRPDKTNTCGIRINHSLAIYMVSKKLQPTTIIESGVNSGQSTYFFRQACPKAKIISMDPEIKPICGQPVRWMDDTNNEYLTGKNFTDFDHVDWQQRISSGDLDPTTTLVFVDDHRGFFRRFPTLVKYNFRHVINEDNYKQGEGATPQDKQGYTPKQMFVKPQNADTQWLFHNLVTYRELPPLVPPSLSKDTPWPKKPQGGFLHNMDDLSDMEEPILRPDLNKEDKAIFERMASSLELDPTLMESQSYQEFMGYCYISYMELVPMSPFLANQWKLIK